MKIINNKVFVMIVVMAMVLSIGTTSLGEEIDLEELVAEDTVIEEFTESTVTEDPVTDEAQGEESPPAEEESEIIEETIHEDTEVEVVIEEIIDEAEQGLQDEAMVEGVPDEELSVVEDEPIDEVPYEEEIIEDIQEDVLEVEPLEEEIQEGVGLVEEIIEDGILLEEEPVVEESITEEVIEGQDLADQEIIGDKFEEISEEVQEEIPVLENPAVVGEAIPVEPLTPELQIVEPVFEEQVIPRYVSLHIGVEPGSERYTNGDLIQYQISIENNGTDPIESLDIVDDMGVDESIGYLDIGERALVKGTYRIDDYNRVDSIGNTVSVAATCDGERISGEVGFVVPVDIPQGSISISNRVNERSYTSHDFIVLVEGPDNYVNYLQLGASDTVTIRNLFIGDYRIRPLDSMNFSISDYESTVSITTSNLDRDISIDYSLENTGWFSDWDYQTVRVMDVDTEDIDFSKIELRSSGLDKRSDEIYLDLEPLIVLVEVQVEALQQPEGEDSSSVADPVQEVTYEPVEAGLQEEVTQPDAAEVTEGLEPIVKEETELLMPEETEDQASTEDTNPVVVEESGQEEGNQDSGIDTINDDESEPLEEAEPVLEEDNKEIELVEPEAVIPENPLGESKAEGEAEAVDDEEEPGEIELQEEITPSTDPEETPVDLF